MKLIAMAVMFYARLDAQPPGLVCAPSSPVAVAGEILNLRAWADTPPGSKPAYRWTVSSGSVQTAGSNLFTWKFDSGTVGVQSADGELRSGATVLSRCLVEVQVVASRRASDPTAFLLPDAKEEIAGLHSYLLMTSAADVQLRRSALQAWLTLTPAIAELRRQIQPNQAISLHIPVLETPAGAPEAGWLLQHYDFSRARTALQRFTRNEKEGVYIVSSLRPLAEAKAPYLIQDLSLATPALAASWIESFINEAAQERSWTAESEAALVDELRTTLRSLTLGMPGFPPPLLLKSISLV